MRLSDVLTSAEFFLERIAALYEDMAGTYARVAEQYGFDCGGCPENCCRTRFYNHTYIEYFHLMEGLAGFPPDRQAAIRNKAEDVCREVAAADAADRTPRVMCPLNVDGLCGAYEHRLMICRLHGLPHELHVPGRQPFYGQGCQIFRERHPEAAYIPFDRTPFYNALAALEKELRQALDVSQKFKKTIAEMIVSPPDLPFYRDNPEEASP